MRISLSILLALSFGGCSSVRPHAVSSATEAAMKQLYIGMTESQALEVMKPVSLDWGRSTSGGTGAGQLLFQISATQQVRIEVEPKVETQIALFPQISLGPEFVVRHIGQLEPKSKWVLDSNHNFVK
jgi:hypothetical protein